MMLVVPIKNKKQLDQLRSYASIFSSTYFLKLIKEDDYSFINSSIKRYDTNKLGKHFNTYYDYIRFVYNQIRRMYQNEYVYKNTLINELIIKKYGLDNSITINEFRVGQSIADMVLFNGTSKAFEIKTELDSNKRLTGQLADYSRIFKECYIVTHESLVDKYQKEDDRIGIIALIQRPRSLTIQEVRPAQEQLYIDPQFVMRSVRTNEYKNIVKEFYGELPQMNSFNMYKTCNKLISQIPPEKLHALFIRQIKQRKTNVSIIDSIYKELRQIGLALNLSTDSYEALRMKLNKPINL